MTTDTCEHIATCTDRIVAHVGPWVHVTEPVTICVTCHATINTEEDE